MIMSKYYNYICDGGCQAGYYQYGVSQMALGNSFYSKIAGVTFDGRQRLISGLAVGQELVVRRDRGNVYDCNAIALFDGNGNQLGFISRDLAARMAPQMDGGVKFMVRVAAVTGGNGYSYGVNINITRLN